MSADVIKFPPNRMTPSKRMFNYEAALIAATEKWFDNHTSPGQINDKSLGEFIKEQLIEHGIVRPEI